MDTHLKIAFIASECVPFAKTGGLADVVGALPKALTQLGHEVIVIMPKYASLKPQSYTLSRFFDTMCVWMGNTEEWCAVDTTTTEEGVQVYFIESHKYFDRYGLYYDADHNDYQDNARRFAFFCRAALQLCHDMGFDADIVHAHDWQAALAPAYLKIWHWNDEVLGKAASVLTIHNIGYQGKYNAAHYEYTGLQWGNFTADKFEDHGAMNCLKGGIYYADVANTVSPAYANETRAPEYAHGLAPYLNNKGANYVGILNGVDYAHWDPAVDSLIPENYSPDDMRGKVICKTELQKRLGLTPDPNIPLIGVISRFVQQKGLDFLVGTIEDIVHTMIVQFAILGSGDRGLEAYFGNLPARYPGTLGSYIGYSNELAHWIEAGADFFIMPSRYEPCGLNQIYSLKYGTLPLVRATGGLDDTVEQYNEAMGEGTGFKFWEPSARAVYYTVGWAVSTYYDRPTHIKQMVNRAMQKRFSWEDSARDYVHLYHQAIQNKGEGD